MSARTASDVAMSTTETAALYRFFAASAARSREIAVAIGQAIHDEDRPLEQVFRDAYAAVAEDRELKNLLGAHLALRFALGRVGSAREWAEQLRKELS